MNRELLKICGIGFVYFAAFGLVAPLVPQFAATLGFAPALIGVLASVGAIMPLLLAVPGGVLTDRFGTRPVLMFGTASCVGAFVLLATSRCAAQVFSAQILAGFSDFFVMVAMQSHVSRLAASRDQGFGYLTFTAALGATVGPIIGGFIASTVGFAPAFFVSVGLCILSLLFIVTLKALPNSPDGRTITVARVAASIRGFMTNRGTVTALASSFAMVCVISLGSSYYPLYLASQSFSPADIGVLVGLQAASTALIRLALFPAIRFWGRRKFLATSLILGGLGFGITPMLTSFAAFACGAFVAGVGKGLSQPLTMIMVANSTHEEERGLAMAFRLMANRLGQVVSPLFLGLVATYASLGAVFPVAMVIPLLAALPTILWIRQEPNRSLVAAESLGA